MSSRDQLYLPNNQHQQRSRVGRLSGNEYARIIPNNFYHDNEQLYSEAIKLKQRTNATLDENVKLKTRIAMLEK
jgi:GGDEF domain-containing protein